MDFKRKSNKFPAKGEAAAEEGREKSPNSFDYLFNQSWEVFVVKKDQASEKFVGKLACCATAGV